MAHSDVGKLIDEFLGAFNKHDVERMLQLYADDCVHSDSLTGSLQGKDAIREYLIALFNAFPDASLSINSAIGGQDLIAMEVITTGTNKGPLPPPLDLPATNRKLELAGASFMILRDGKIAVQNVYADFGVMLERLRIASLPVEIQARAKEKETGK